MDHMDHDTEHTGHTVEDHAEHGMDHTGHEETFRRRFWFCLVLTFPVLFWSPTVQDWFGYSAPEFTGSGLIVPVFATVIFIYGGIPFLQMARWELQARSPGMMTLISLAITVAFVFSMATLVWDSLGEDFFWELATLIDVMLLGHWMEMRSVRIASGALDALADLLPDRAEVVSDDGRIEERRLNEVNTGDVVVVRPGAGAATDGSVVEGRTDMDESMLTGESRPVKKDPGDEVIAGTINTGVGTLRMKVTAVGDDTALAGIMRLVAEAQASKSRTQLLADRAASFLFYAALVSAAIAALVWTAVEGGVTQRVVATVVTILVIACPHALGLAIPLVVANTTAIAARHGTLIRSRDAIDTAKDLELIAFDKTGTLTKGEIGITGLKTVGDIGEDEALEVAAAVEADSEHSIARAFRNRVDPATTHRVEDFEILKGQGVRAHVNGREIHMGGPNLLASLSTSLPPALDEFTATSGKRGDSVIYLVEDREPVAAFALADVVRPESHLAIEALNELGVKAAMITGDSKDVAAAVAHELNIDRYFAEVLPADKDRLVQDLQRDGTRVGMVGDGVNDAPALARADIGIAVGSGTDVAVRSADLVLVKSNPLDIVRILKLSAAAYRKQVQNIWWAAGYNIVMIPLAAGVLAPWGVVVPPAVGALVMSISTIVVAINAQLLRRYEV